MITPRAQINHGATNGVGRGNSDGAGARTHEGQIGEQSGARSIALQKPGCHLAMHQLMCVAGGLGAAVGGWNFGAVISGRSSAGSGRTESW